MTRTDTPPIRRNPLLPVLELFSSVRFGIVLMSVLFVYCSIGSAGIIYPVSWNILDGDHWRHEFVRTWRAFELSEFEWFHTWFFNGLIALIAANILVTTVRKIPLTVLSAGVWCIHGGIIILCIGSVIYFGAKFEGDTPVIRRAVSISFPDRPPVTIPAMPGARAEVRTERGSYAFQVAQVQPDWPIISEPDKGKTAYAVTVAVRSPQMPNQFMRQMLAGFPQYTEDIIPGKGRAVKQPEFGRAIIDDSFTMSLEPMAQDRFWLAGTVALCARDAGTRAWVERPIRGMPKYNDYVRSPDDVTAGEERTPVAPLSIDVPPAGAPNDPLAGATVRVTGFLRYADPREAVTGGGPRFDPYAHLELTTGEGKSAEARLLASDPARNTAFNGEVVLRAAESIEQAEAAGRPTPNRLVLRVPRISDEFPGGEVTAEFTRAEVRRRLQSPPPPEIAGDTPSIMRAGAPWTPIPGSPFSFRVRDVVERLQLSDNSTVALAIVEFRSPERSFQRWVFEDPSRNRDMSISTEAKPSDPHDVRDPDPRIVTEYEANPSPTLMLVAAKGSPNLIGFVDEGTGEVNRFEVAPGGTAAVRDGLTMRLAEFIPDAVRSLKPHIVPRRMRDKDIDIAQLASLFQVEITEAEGGRARRVWLPFHAYSVEDPALADVNMGRYAPTTIELSNGRIVELMMSRESRPLPAPVVLDDFILTSQVGGYTGSVSSIRDWTSVVRFGAGAASTEPMTVSSNNPAEHAGCWFFQKTWDPQGLRFTGLGVGNREGVYIQLAGCTIAVGGMLYAFYVKPIIRRRRIQMVHAQVAARRQAADPERPGETPPASVNGEARAAASAPRFERVPAETEHES